MKKNSKIIQNQMFGLKKILAFCLIFCRTFLILSFLKFVRIAKSLAIFFVAISMTHLASAESLQNNLSNNDIIREVEKTLLFSDAEKSKTELMQRQLNQKSDFNIVAGEKNYDKNDAIIINIKETKKVVDVDTRTKEKMAYNATLNGQYEVAIELYKQVIVSEPDNNYALLSLATIYQKVGQLRQAKTIYYTLLQNNPENKEEIVSNILSTLSAESPRDSLYLLVRLSTSNPQSPYILVQTALAYSGVKNYEKASDLLLQAIALDPDRLDYKYNLAIIYDKAGNYNKAFASYQEVIRGYDDNKWATTISLKAVQMRLATIQDKI